MKKVSQHSNLYENELPHNKNLETDLKKTTNINILLNRVKLDKKKDLRKKIILFSILLIVTFCVGFFFIY